ncbi:MAG TPA: cytidylate kinase family protein [Candidatus Binataceae bacterium]|nr:cytidylate kinase family protein [Candidatus Binataceae bacterium]
MAIIAVTQQLGSRGIELGRLAATQLGYRFMSSEDVIAETSHRYAVTPEQLVVVDERQPHFWSRLKTESVRFISFFRATLLREMALDDLVVVGRSAGVILPPLGCGLRVRTVGPFDDRVKRVCEDEKLALVAGQRRVRDYDREVRARIQTLLNVDIEDPAAFDLVINGYGAPLDLLARMLADTALQIDARVTPEQWQHMRDTAVAAQVRAACHSHPKLGLAPIDVQCDLGTVRVKGPGLVPPWDALALSVARQVEGVNAVEVEADEPAMPVRPD